MSSRSRIKMRVPKKNLSSEVAFDETWDKLAIAIQQILSKEASQLSFEKLYRTVYNLVLIKFGRQVYENTKNVIRKHLETEVAADLVPLVHDPSVTANQIFKLINKQWSDHCFCMRLVSDIMMYLDRVYASEERLPLIYDAGITLFRDAVIRNGTPQVGVQLYDILIGEIQKERRGEAIDKISMKNVISMLESLPENRLDGDSIYLVEFEPKLEKATVSFYRNAASEHFDSGGGDAGTFLRKVEQWQEEETTRCNLYLVESSTLPKMLQIMDQHLIIGQLERVITSDTGLGVWIEYDRYEEIALLARLVRRVSTTFDEIRESMTAGILVRGREINQEASRATDTARKAKAEGIKDKSGALNPTAISIKWVDDVLKLKDKYDKILQFCFDNDSDMQIVIENAFSLFVNENQKAAEFLSLFLDDNLKKTLKGKTDEEVEQTLDKAITLFRFVAAKDLFETYYKAHLAKRLLNNKSVSIDVERNMVAKIKLEAGTAFTAKLEGMFKDMETSRDMMQSFKSHESSKSGCEINVSMLTSSYWPATVVTTSQTRCIYPAAMTRAKEAFEKFYLSKHSGRLLHWNPNMGSGDVKARFKKKTHEINLPTYALTILMLFNDLGEDESLSYESIKNATAIPEADLMRHLQSISVAPKTRLLRKEPMSKNINLDDKFYFNAKFESPMTRIKVLTISSGTKVESDQERKQTMDQIDKSRRYETEAAIVRTMKARKTMDHANLIVEVTKLLAARFKPDPTAIKGRIDALLEREYLERDANDRSTYRYLA